MLGYMPEVISQFSLVCLASIFTWAAIAKVARPGRWRSALARYELGRPLERVAAFGVPIAEALTVVVLLWGDARVGAALVAALISLFSLAIVRAREMQGDRIPCGCFGRASTRDVKDLLARNAFLGLGAAIVLLSGRRELEWTFPGASELVATLLVVLGMVLIAWVVSQASNTLRRRV